jgi:hypothetical protein
LFRTALLTRLHVITVRLDFLNDIFLLHFALEPAQCVFQRLTFLNANFSHLDFTVLPMHVAMIAINHEEYKRPNQPLTAYWHSLLADPPVEVKLCF